METTTHKLQEDFLEHTAWLKRLASALIGDDGAADDLVQETLLVAMQKQPDSSSSTRAWLRQVLRNAWRMQHRSSQRRGVREEIANLQPAADPSPQDWTERLEVHEILTRLVRELEEPHRSVILLHFVEGLSAADIARKKNLPPTTVRSQLKRGLDELRTHMEVRYGSSPAWRHALLPLIAGPSVMAPLASPSETVTTTKGTLTMTATKLLALLTFSIILVWAVAPLVTGEPLSQGTQQSAETSSLPERSGEIAISERASYLDGPRSQTNEGTGNSEMPSAAANSASEPIGPPLLTGVSAGSDVGRSVGLDDAQRCIDTLQRQYDIRLDEDRRLKSVVVAPTKDNATAEEQDCIEQYVAGVLRGSESAFEHLESILSETVTFGVGYAVTAIPADALFVSPGGPTLGPEGAAITVTVFSDFQCTYCADVVASLDELQERYPEQVRLQYKHLPLPSRKTSLLAAEASMAADAQGKFWPMHDMLYANPKSLNEESLVAYARTVGLDVAQFRADLASHSYLPLVEQDIAEAAALGISDTPSVVIKGELLVGAQPVERFVEAVEEALKAQSL
ncbi:MAG: sigma-70 family RNA polymerase sigma factor [Myxococcales bacterium]|nr:sigma-70 family RNA polymerase sigma factor [Myxococcales bacterium]